MTSFVVLTILMSSVAAAFVVVPLWRSSERSGKSFAADDDASRAESNLEVLRNQFREIARENERGVLSNEQYQAAVAELEQRVIVEGRSDRADEPPAHQKWGVATIVLLGAVVPLLAGILYWHLGTPKAIVEQAAVQGETPTAAQIAAGVAEAQRRVQADPKDTQAWLMLARGMIVSGQDDAAGSAYEKVIALAPAEPEPILELAELLARKNGSLAGRPTQLIEQAVAVAPRYWKALALSGRAAFDRGDYGQALQRWETLREIVPKNSTALAAIEQGINEAHARLKNSAAPISNKAGNTASSVSGTVSIDESLRARAQADETVFVFARMPAGPPMPLAVLRKQVRDLPFDFTLDDSMAMSPEMRISNAQEIVVEARVSKSGDAMPKSGDLQGKSAVIAPGGSALQLRIDTVVP